MTQNKRLQLLKLHPSLHQNLRRVFLNPEPGDPTNSIRDKRHRVLPIITIPVVKQQLPPALVVRDVETVVGEVEPVHAFYCWLDEQAGWAGDLACRVDDFYCAG